MPEVGPAACPNCGWHTEATATACPRCGLSRNQPVFDAAGSYLGTTFAPIQHTRVAPSVPLHQPAPAFPPVSAPDDATRPRSRRALAVILGAVVVIVLGVAAGLVIANLPSGDDPDRAVPPSVTESQTQHPTPTTEPPNTETPTREPANSLPPSTDAPEEPPSTPVVVPDLEPEAPAPRGPAEGPISGTETHVFPSGARCVGPNGWPADGYEGGHQWYTATSEVLCASIAGGTARVRSMVEDEWARTWDVTFSDGDATQYRASGYTDDGRIFWLGAKARSGSADSVWTYWIYPVDDKTQYDAFIEQAWRELTPP